MMIEIRVGIVALPRRLLIDLWRLVEYGSHPRWCTPEDRLGARYGPSLVPRYRSLCATLDFHYEHF